MKTALAVMTGGGLGSLLRYAASLAIAERWGGTFPWGTLAVNVAGSFGIGLFAGLTAVEGLLLVPPTARVFVMVGIFGDAGKHSRFAVGVSELPFGVAVEVDATFVIE